VSDKEDINYEIIGLHGLEDALEFNNHMAQQLEDD
jgi:hypothetical protein